MFDYRVLMNALSGYSKPRDAVTRLLSDGTIVRIGKGLYCFGHAYRRGNIQKEYIANLLYGPSYVSLEYALQFYGMIPERVHTITSVTVKRTKDFDTPLGRFHYRMLSPHRYNSGYTLHDRSPVPFLIATPEKALVDKLWTDRRFSGTRIGDFADYLEEDLRINRNSLEGLDRDMMLRISDACNSAKIRNLVTYLERIWRGHGS